MSQFTQNSSGGGGTTITTILGDVGSISGSVVTIYANQAALNSGSTVSFVNGGTVSTFNVTDTRSNTIIGQGSGNSSILGGQNTSLGAGNLTSLVGGGGCVAIGNICLSSMVSDNYHTAIGTAALNLVNGSVGLTACGYTALSATVNDTGCSAFGYQSLAQLSGGGSANNNSAFGYNSLFYSFTDSDNSAFGFNALTNTQGGSFNCAYGSQSMQGSTPSRATRNCGFGYQTLFTSGTGCISNVAVGAQSLYSTVSDSYCVAIGDGALQNINGVSGITACGHQALYNSVLDAQNTALGYQAMYSTNAGGMGGNGNVASGYQTMYSNISGSQCVASGVQALYTATIPIQSVAQGFQAMFSSIQPTGCTATGCQALYSSQSDEYHCAYGDSALYSVNGSNNCTAFGAGALASLVTGQNSTALGYSALSASQNAEGNLGLGYNSGSNLGPTDAFNVLIASNGVNGDNGVIRIGDATGTPAQNQFNAAYFCGINQNTQDPVLAGPQVVTISTGNQLGVTSLLSGAIQTINTDSGSVTGNTITLYANNAANDNGATVTFQGKTSTVIELQVTDSNNNTFIGKTSGNIAQIGLGCTSLGRYALSSAANVGVSTAIGYQSLSASVSDNSNTACGAGSCAAINGVNGISAFGAGALNSSVNDPGSSAFGFQCMNALNGSGASNNNTGMGYTCLQNATTAVALTAYGASSLININGAQYTSAFGYNSGSNYTGTESNNIVINSPGVLGESNVLRIGSGTGTGNQQLSTAFISGIVGNTVGSALMVTIDSATDQLGVQAIPGGGSIQTVTSVNNSASPYTVLNTDQFIACQASTGLITIKLPNAPTTGQVWTIKDSNGASAGSNISVTTVGGTVTIDGSTTYTIATNYQSISVIFDGTNYEVL